MFNLETVAVARSLGSRPNAFKFLENIHSFGYLPNRSASDGKVPAPSTSRSAVHCDLFLACGNRLVSAKGQKTQRRYATKKVPTVANPFPNLTVEMLPTSSCPWKRLLPVNKPTLWFVQTPTIEKMASQAGLNFHTAGHLKTS